MSSINLVCNIVSYTTSLAAIATRKMEAPLLSDACTVEANIVIEHTTLYCHHHLEAPLLSDAYTVVANIVIENTRLYISLS